MSSCWCCERPIAVLLYNRPALPAIRYRVGTYATFRRAMLDAIAGEPALATWTSRASEDYGIQLVELWAYLADVLTFYQERFANETWLRTAAQRESILHLAELLGYRLAPGVAATVYLAFTVDARFAPPVPAGLRAQSKPAPGMLPATFETEAPLSASAALNRFSVWPEPGCNLDNYVQGGTQANLLSGGADLKTGNSLLFFAGAQAEEKKVTALTATDLGTRVTWSPPIATAFSNGAEVYRFGRIFKLFGNGAPPSYTQPTLDKNGNITGAKPVQTDYSQGSGTTLYLDGVVPNLQLNSQVLVAVRGDTHAGSYNGLFTISSIAQAGWTVGPLTATVTQLGLTSPSFPPVVPRVNDIRTVQVYELTSAEVTFSRQSFPAQLVAGSTRLYSDRVQASDVATRSLAMIADASGQAEKVTIDAVMASTCEGGLIIEVTPPLANSYDGATAVLYGNVVKATHGETIKDETLGSGDGSQGGQTFALQKSPVTFTPDPTADGGIRDSLQVSVDGVRWTEAPTLFGRQPGDRLFTTAIDENNVMRVQFGDGRLGARLPTGRDNVHARYRKGWGQAGRAAAGSISTLLDTRPGLKAVTNPALSFGWQDPQTVDQERQNVPRSVLTFDRAVSLRDFENLARSYPGVGKARAAWIWLDGARAVQLTCAGSDGASIAPLKDGLLRFLDARRDPNRQLVIDDFAPVGITLHAFVVAAPDRVAADVLAAAQSAMGSEQLPDGSYGFFAFARRDLGEAVYLSAVYAALQAVPGVVACDIVELHRDRQVIPLHHLAGLLFHHAPTRLESIVPMAASELATITAAANLRIELKDAL